MDIVKVNRFSGLPLFIYKDRRQNMKASVDKSGCIACGMCVNTCPGVFQMGDDGLAESKVDEIPADEEPAAELARDGCPVSVIDIG